MRNINTNSKGFGLIWPIITIGIIVLIIFGYTKLKGSDSKNQIQAGQDAIDKAREAAEQQNQNSIFLQNQVQ